MARALISVPTTAKRGEVLEIKTLVQHPMETGYRRDNAGGAIPRDIIEKFVCTYNGEEVFSGRAVSRHGGQPVHRLLDGGD